MQKPSFSFATKGLIERSPFSSITTISPGSTSRINLAPGMMSNAQLSLESSHAPSTLPIQSGRKPSESRTPITSRSLSSTSENAPFTLQSAWTRLLSLALVEGFVMR